MICEVCHGTREKRTYYLTRDGRAIVCQRCGNMSHHPKDVSEKYCGYCHRFHETEPCPACGGCGTGYCCEGAAHDPT